MFIKCLQGPLIFIKCKATVTDKAKLIVMNKIKYKET